jgi:tripartite ATP-independent transporter DctM subunit
MILAGLNRRLDWPMLWNSLVVTTRITTMVVFILVGSTVFSLVFQGFGGADWIRSILGYLPGGELGFLIFVNVLIFVLAFFLDFFEIAFIVLPLLVPVAEHLGIDLVWFGVLLAANMQTSFMHPPFGFALFYLRSIAPPSVKTSDIYLGALPWVGLQLILVVLIIVFPEIVTAFMPGESGIDPAGVKIDLPSIDFGTGGGDLGAPPSFSPRP